MLPAVALGFCVVVAAFSASTIDFSKVPAPAVQPMKGAFGIWGPIFAASIGHAIVSGVSGEGGNSALFLGVSYAVCAVWAAAIRRDRYAAASAALLVALLSAAAASATSAMGRGRAHWIFELSSDLLVSWLLVACLLGLVIAGASRLDTTQALVAVATATAAVAAATGKPALCVGIGWACAMQQKASWWHVVGACVALVGAIAAFFVRFGG